MNNIAVNKIKWDEIQDLITDYLVELGYKNDGFHNNMMLEGEPYIIIYNDEILGFFSLGDSWDNGKMLRGFYIIPSKRRVSVEIFNKLVEDFHIEAALVASNDAHFVGLAFEKMNALKTTFDMQAFNFIYGAPEREPEYGMNCVVEVNPWEYETMNSLTEKQWEDSFGDENYKFYVIKNNNEILGYGSIGKLKYNPKNVDVGNYTLPQHRRKGVGRSIIINMSKIAIQQGLIPVAGCWYGNTESIATLTSSGFILENRIFYVRFC
ncbi:MAG: GNAT family N-acetyltransferase [Clostridiales bacterium]|nr:GNAT family N-acetyltransferase [Clostridiales bacterium]